jgi:hypothetical protein
MLDLLDKLDSEYKWIKNLGGWTKKEDPRALSLTATISNLQSQSSSIKSQYGFLQALITKNMLNNSLLAPTASRTETKLPPKQSNDPETTVRLTWKWCDKCFGGSWNCTKIISEHVPGVGKCNQ